jgi:hypothetical protein
LRQEAEHDSRTGRVNSSPSPHSYTYVLLLGVPSLSSTVLLLRRKAKSPAVQPPVRPCVNLAPFSDKEVPRYRYSQYDQHHVLLAAGVPVVQATCEPRSQIRMDWWWRIRGPSKRLRLRGKQGESSHNALRIRSLFGYSSASARSAALPQSTPTEHPTQYDTPATIKKTCPPAIARVGFRTCWISRQKSHQAW